MVAAWECHPTATETTVKIKPRSKLIHEGNYVAEVDVELIEMDDEWSPYLSLEEAGKLDDVREALRRGDLKKASRYGRVYDAKPPRFSIGRDCHLPAYAPLG